ncbi:hypothetical protein [Nonomuraea endophytica]|uniref:Uncharacterized protein n=1 Tax=Nonomuraea endophytica TaxID=714136 RepID=A0A7W8A6X7_9ACTN|nr:hypothetical protein [Nonomuraea endophytica]MBB5080194.1 hypothetical protein [Nonomuraea endophytica]
MKWTRHGFLAGAAGAVVVVWVAAYAVILVNSEQLPAPDAAILYLVGPPVVWAGTAALVLHHWWGSTLERMSVMDPPQRLLTTAVAALPERRREWGLAMIAELAGIEGRTARWQFALSSARAMLWLRPAGGWPALVLTAAAAVAAAVAAGTAMGTLAPGLTVLAASFTAIVGAMAVLTVARAPRLRLPAPIATALVVSGVAAAIVMTVIFFRTEPAAAQHLPPAAAIYVAAVLASCLWIALGAPRWLGTDRAAPRLATAGAVGFAAWFLVVNFMERNEPSPVVALLTAPLIVGAPLAAFIVPAFVAGRVGRSFRAGLRAAIWTVAAAIPLTYAVWLPQGLSGGVSLVDESGLAPVSANLADALTICLVVLPLIGLPLAVFAAALGARLPSSAADPGDTP